MKLSLKIALRYLFSKKSTNAINIISLVSMIGMGLGTFALIILLSVFNGFENLVLDLQNSFYSDIEVKPKKGKTFEPSQELISKMDANETIESLSFVLEENAYIKYESKERIATIKGVDENYFETSSISNSIVSGSEKLIDNNINYAILGSGIDYILGTNVNRPSSAISINIPKKNQTSAIVASQLFHTGQVMPGAVFMIQSEFDNKYMIIPLSLMRKITKSKTEISAIEIRVKDKSQINELKESLIHSIGGEFDITPRFEQDKALYKAMKAERWAVFAILSLIMFIISFNIVGSLSMISIEKKQDISILKAMGLNKINIERIFIFQGVLGAVIGAITGLVLGLILLFLQKKFGFIGLPSNGGFVIDSYPVYIKVIDIILSFLIVLIISIIASIYPSKRASNQGFVFSKE